MFWGEDSNEKTKNIYRIFLGKFPKIIIHIWIQQFFFGSKQKYLWNHFDTIKKPLKNRANATCTSRYHMNGSALQIYTAFHCVHFPL